MAGGRIRTLKPELLEDEEIANLTSDAFRLFIGCILLSDDHGNLRGALAYLRGQVFWAHEVNPEDALAELIDRELVEIYEVNGQAYLHVTGWKKHQKIDKPGKPKVPGPDEKDPDSRTFAKVREDSRKVAPRARAQDRDLDLDQEEDQEGDPPLSPPNPYGSHFGSL